MTFYQELQLNQAGSKELLRKSETAQERRYHALIYLAKVAITMLFCFAFVSVFSILFGNENSVVGVVVLGCIQGNLLCCWRYFLWIWRFFRIWHSRQHHCRRCF